ncbi:putative Vsr/MutH/archaeal HJR family endonuclease [Port-miou virus]|uniref:Putative Vsr/MutH/archaeal HJR family endonuclease n=1 Tax=Port-miou virus TaxID=1733873 RepID=A0A0N9Q136_9VIRU|nr:putative Vsr/MutH/archaeal HJR family endonuclease [Port-miou virus]
MSLEKRTEEARRRFALKGCTMTGKYVSSREKVEYVCGCGKEGKVSMKSVNLESWVGCKECSDRTHSKKRGTTNAVVSQRTLGERTENARRILEAKGCILTGEYVNNYTKVEYTCKCGKEKCEVKISIAKGEKWVGCSDCSLESRKKTNFERYGNTCSFLAKGSRKKTQEEAAKFLWEKNKCIMTGEYIGYRKPVEYTCHCGRTGCLVSLSTAWKKNWAGCSECGKKQHAETNMRVYGVECALKNKKVREKIAATNMEKRGVDNPSKDPKVREKFRETMKERYDVEYPIQNPEIKEKIKETLEKTHGVECAFQTQKCKEKSRAALTKKYGPGGAFSDPEVRRKCKETNKARHGYEHIMHNDEIFAKRQKSAFGVKKFVLPSGREIAYQGYEHFAIQLLLDEGNNEENIFSCFDKKIRVGYTYLDKFRKYQPDIFIQDTNTVVEVKSTWTFSKMHGEKEKTLAKLETCRREGYNTRLLVFSPKGEVLLDEKKTKDE